MKLSAGGRHRRRIRSRGRLRSRFAESALLLLRRRQSRAQRLDARWRHRLQRTARRRTRRRSRHGALAPGAEDPSLWSIWDTPHPDDAARAKLAEMPPGYDLILEGSGDIWRITATPQRGQRTFDYDAASRHNRRRNLRELSAFLSHRADGRGAKAKSRSVSTTAPIREWTPQILDILEAKARPRDVFRDRHERQRIAPETRSSANTTKATRSAITPTRIPTFEDISQAQIQWN